MFVSLTKDMATWRGMTGTGVTAFRFNPFTSSSLSRLGFRVYPSRLHGLRVLHTSKEHLGHRMCLASIFARAGTGWHKRALNPVCQPNVSWTTRRPSARNSAKRRFILFISICIWKQLFLLELIRKMQPKRSAARLSAATMRLTAASTSGSLRQSPRRLSMSS